VTVVSFAPLDGAAGVVSAWTATSVVESAVGSARAGRRVGANTFQSTADMKKTTSPAMRKERRRSIMRAICRNAVARR